jgi:hypothetical protein
MHMEKIIYGVDTSKKITPIIVKNAIIECFRQAHKETLDIIDKYAEWKSEEEHKDFRDLEIELTIKNTFRTAEVDFENPTKEGLAKVLDGLQKFAVQFRKPEIVQKHYSEIKSILDKCE